MSPDYYTLYEANVQQLLDYLGNFHPSYNEALTYQHRLLENIAATRRYGDTESRRAERAEIIAQINNLACDTGAPILLTQRDSSSPGPQMRRIGSMRDGADAEKYSGAIVSGRRGSQQQISPNALPDVVPTRYSAISLIPTTTIMVLAVVGTIISTIWLVLSPDFEPLLAVITSLTLLMEALMIQKQLYHLAIAILVGALAMGGLAYASFAGVLSSPGKTNVAVRVIAPNGAAIPRANVIVLVDDQVPPTKITDANGIVHFVDLPTSEAAQLVAQADGYQAYDQVVDLAISQNFTLMMSPGNAHERSVIIRVTETSVFRPIATAEVILIADGEIYTAVTDQHGLAKFALNFVEPTLDVNLAVTAEGKQTSDQQVTLQPNQLQEVRLDGASNTIDIPPASHSEEVHSQ